MASSHFSWFYDSESINEIRSKCLNTILLCALGTSPYNRWRTRLGRASNLGLPGDGGELRGGKSVVWDDEPWLVR